MHSWDQELGRPHKIMEKVWQMMENNDTKTMNQNRDFDELMSKAQQTGWNGPTTTRFWTEKKKTTTRNRDYLRPSPRMEVIVSLAVEWFSLGEMMVLQGVSVRERVAIQGHSERY